MMRFIANESLFRSQWVEMSNRSILDGLITKQQGATRNVCSMYALTELRSQHDTALCMAERLIDMIDEYRCDADAPPIALQFNRLFGLLRVHLAHEDVQLYPALVESGDRRIAQLALAYVSEMGGLASELELFAQRWSCSAVIASDFYEFAEAARELVLRLAFRIERENRHLYPLAQPQAQRAA